jgi:hypothetical protein
MRLQNDVIKSDLGQPIGCRKRFATTTTSTQRNQQTTFPNDS